MSPPNFVNICRLCLGKDKASIPIFEGEGAVRQIFTKIVTCLPVKVEKSDPLPKKICDVCLYNVENVFKFWHTTASSEKKLLQWLEGTDKTDDIPLGNGATIETEQIILKEETIEQEHTLEQVKHQENEGFGEDVERSDDGISDEEGFNSEENVVNDTDGDKNSGVDGDSDEEGYGELQPTTFVNVSLACDDQPGPSGLQTGQSLEQQLEIVQPLVTQTKPSNETSQEVHSGQPDAVPSTSKTNPASSGYGTKTFIWSQEGSSGNECTSKPSVNSNSKSGRKRPYVKSGKYSKKKYLKSKTNDKKVNSSGLNPQEENESESILHSVKLERDEKKETFTCGECCVTFSLFDDLDKHMKEHGKESENNEITEDSNSRFFECTDCDKIFSSKILLSQHVIVHSGERTCKICKKTFKRSYDLTKHKKKHEGECEVCGYKTIYRSALATHRKRHFEEFKYKCDICGKGFFVLTWLEEHKNFHTGEKPFQCDECGKAFAYTRYLAAHKRASHPDAQHPPKINQCETCGKVFAHKKSLSLHKKSHTGENICLCDICGKALTSKEHLKFHRRIHTGEKPNVCGWCGKAFSKRCNLKLHERVHTGERPYTCDICGKSFTQRSTLVIHKRYHTGQRPYVCHLCDKGFVCKGLLNVHFKTKCI